MTFHPAKMEDRMAYFLQRAAGVSIFLWLSAVTACAPDTRYRRTALVPPARSFVWDGRTAREGSLRVEASVSGSHVWENPLPIRGDTAVRVPTTMVDGAAAVALTRGFELGARYAFGAYDWSSESAYGTLEIPGSPSVSGLGPEARGTIRLGKDGAFGIGIGGNYLIYSIPTATWERDDTCTPSSTCVSGLGVSWVGSRYRLIDSETKSKAVINIGIYPSYEFSRGDYGHIFGGFSLHESFKNDGFSDDANGKAVEGNGFIFLAGAGYGISVDMFRASAMVSYPFTSRESAVYYDSISFFLAIGVDLPLWTRDEPASPEPQKPAPESAAPAARPAP